MLNKRRCENINLNYILDEIVHIMNTQKCVTTTMENINNQTISIRKCTEPTVKVKVIYEIENSTLRIYGCNVG